jgi:hypothetical protein
MDEKTLKSWEGFLNPDILRVNLITASLYIAAFAVLKNTIINRIKDFYLTGFDKSLEKDGGWIIDPKYRTQVLSRNPSPVYASLDWLKESHAIDDRDIAAFERAKKCRNDVAHRINQILSDGLPVDLPDRFAEMFALVDKIESWWIVNVEIPTNPDLDGKEIDEAGIIPGQTMGLRLLMDLALGSEEESKFYIDEFLKRTNSKVPRPINRILMTNTLG